MATATSSPELAPLVTILSHQKAVYQKLLQLAADERQAIVDGNLPKLKAALQGKQDVLERLSSLEERRIAWLQRYAAQHRLSTETTTLAEIIESSAGQDRQVLRRLHNGLRRHIDRLVEMNAVTKALLEKIVGSIDTSLRYLLAPDGAGQTYGAQGRLLGSAALSRQLLETTA